MAVERMTITPAQALGLLGRVHRRAPGDVPNRARVIGLARQMIDAYAAGEPWQQTAERRLVFSRADGDRPAGVILGREVLLALVYAGLPCSLLIERDASLATYTHEVDPELEPVMAGNGVQLNSKMTIDTWVDDPGPSADNIS